MPRSDQDAFSLLPRIVLVSLLFTLSNLFAQRAVSTTAVVENGKKVFAAQGCDKCHGTTGQGGAEMVGPKISPPPQPFPGFISQVREPKGVMPSYSQSKVSDADLRAVYAFLQAKESGKGSTPSAAIHAPGDSQNGKVLYMKDGCWECHGRFGEGSAATGPRLNPPPVSLDALVHYLRHPSGNMPPYTEKVVSDSELADIFAFLQSLPAPPKVENIPLLK